MRPRKPRVCRKCGLRCPVCSGSGRVYQSGVAYNTSGDPCHGCAQWGSKGWILVDDGSVFDPHLAVFQESA